MEELGLWRLFFATGLPQAYLALRGQQEEDHPAGEPATAAFSNGTDGEREA